MLQKQLLSLAALASLTLSLIGGLSVAVPVGAQVDEILTSPQLEDIAQFSYKEGRGTEPTRSIQDIIVLIINTILGLLGVIFLVIIIYAGFLWMTAGGNDEQVGKAKKLLINSIIGIIIIVAAYAISYFVLHAILPNQIGGSV